MLISSFFIFPCAEGDPYYPVPRAENDALYARYKELSDATPGVYFVGRLATYKYYNMDQVVAQALTTYAKIKERKLSKGSEVTNGSRSRIAAALGGH